MVGISVIENNLSADTQKISFFEYLYVFMLVLYAGRGNEFFNSTSFTENTIGVFIPILFSGILAFRWRIIFNQNFYLLLLFFSIYFVAVSIKYGDFQPSFLLTYYILFFVVYSAVKSLKFNLFVIYEYFLFLLAIVSLFMWVIQIGLGGDTLFNLFSRSSYLQLISSVSGNGINAFFYSVQPYATTLINNYTIPRNCGFAWEPGSFAIYICLAIFINLFISKNDENRRLRFWVLTAALISTQSTTGYIIYMLIMTFNIINKKLHTALLLLPVAIVLMVTIFSLPFMKDKIIELISETSRLDQLLIDSYGREDSATPQRFMSFLITFKDFLNNPLLGIAAHREESWVYQLGSHISPISGIGFLLSQFGIIGSLFFFIVSIKSSIYFSRYFGYRGRLLLFLIIFAISISYTILFISLIMIFWMFSLFEDELPVNKNVEMISKEDIPPG
jgi:hypothetical protein